MKALKIIAILSIIIIVVYLIFIYYNRDKPLWVAEATALLIASPIPPIP